MNVTSRLGGTTAGLRGAGLSLPTPSREVSRLLTKVLLVAFVFVLAGAVGLGLYASSHAGRIYQGVHAAGVDLSGLTPDAARATLDANFATYAAQPLVLTAGEHTFELTPAEAGARLDSAATVAAAMAWGREGSMWDQSRAWARALIRGVAIDPVVMLDSAAARDSIAAFAPTIVKPAIDATLEFGPSGNPEIVPDVTGVRLDYAATESELAERISAFASDPVPLVTVEDPAIVTAASLAPSLPDASAVVDAPLLITAGESAWHIPAASLQPLLSVDPSTSELRIDQRPLTPLVESLAAEVNREAVDAGITVDESGRLAVVPAVYAAKVDVAASVAAIADGLLRGQDEVSLVVTESPPQILDPMAEAAVAYGEDLMDPGIALEWDGGEGFLDRGDLLRALTIRTKPGAEQPFIFGLDRDLVQDSLSRYALEFDVPVQDARWRLVDGEIELAVRENKGRELDIEGGADKVIAAFLDEKPKVTLDVRTLNPRWKASDERTIVLGTNILAEGGTWYGDSSDARRQNIELGASLVSGWLVPPDGIFSFADSVGLITEEKGFVTGLGIVDNGNGGFTTAPVTGGGICQVSTTLYQAIFWAGLPIVERHQHPYYLRNYGESVSGLPGLDAMVNIEPDWRIDLRFKNTTGHWMAVIMIPDGQMLWSRLVGTHPGWEVVVPEPVISNEVKADTRMYYTESPELPLGQERIVESAQDGFDVTIHRSVYDDGKLILEDEVFSSFAPSRNTTMQGTGTETG